MEGNLKSRAVVATKWSAFAEIAAKLVNPITSMVLARLLAPEAYGVVATLMVVISFAEIFTDAGFQKYLIQHEFKDEEELERSTNVAFWSNLALSLFIWLIIILFRNPLALLVGSPDLGNALAISCVCIPLAAFTSIQMALYKRALDFKTLFKVRIIGILVPVFVTIPLAIFLRNFWALVLGTIAVNLVNAFFLTYFSKWKPRFFYSLGVFKEMFSFTIWSMIEAVSIWLTGYLDLFIVGRALSQYYLGLYRTSSTIVGQILGLITATTTPILFSSLSRLQNDDEEFKKFFYRFQKLVGMLVIPAGVGIFCFKELVTTILLGNQWVEAAGFIGLWGLTSSITIVFCYYASEVYRAKGRPKFSVLDQCLHLVVLIPTILIAVKYGFETLYIARSLVRLEAIVVSMILMYILSRISPLVMMKNLAPAFIATGIMAAAALLLRSVSDNMVWQFFSIAVCVAVYVGVMCLFPEERSLFREYSSRILKRGK